MALTKRQIAARRRGIGGSEMLAALGKDPRCSRLELYKRKVGDLPERDLSDDERVRFGILLEPVLRKELSRRIGHEIVTVSRTLQHPTAPIVAHPDGWIPALGEGVEIKTADKFEADEFGELESDQVPVRYLVQCAAYMAVTDAPRWRLGVLIGGNELRQYMIPRDPQIEAAIVAGAHDFWTHVEKLQPPEPQTPDDVRLLWPKDLGTTVVATPEIEVACNELALAKKALKEAELHEGSVKMALEQFMGEHAQLVDPSGKLLATWRKNKDSTVFDTKAFAAAHPDLYQQFLRVRMGARPFLLK